MNRIFYLFSVGNQKTALNSKLYKGASFRNARTSKSVQRFSYGSRYISTNAIFGRLSFMASFPLRDATRHPKPIAGKDLCAEENPREGAYVSL